MILRELAARLGCGLRGDGQVEVSRVAGIEDAEQRDYLFMRKNERGPHHERWRCDRGCGKWFNAVRDTVTMEFIATYGIREEPPAT